DRVEYHVEPFIVGKALYVGFHCLRPIVDRLGSAHAHRNRARFRRYRGKNLCAKRRGELYGYVADATGPAVNQDALPWQNGATSCCFGRRGGDQRQRRRLTY